MAERLAMIPNNIVSKYSEDVLQIYSFMLMCLHFWQKIWNRRAAQVGLVARKVVEVGNKCAACHNSSMHSLSAKLKFKSKLGNLCFLAISTYLQMLFGKKYKMLITGNKCAATAAAVLQ